MRASRCLPPLLLACLFAPHLSVGQVPRTSGPGESRARILTVAEKDASAPDTAAPASGAKEATKLPPDLLPLAQKAKAQFDHGDYRGAEATYRRILEKAPDNLYTLTNLGVTLFRAQKFKQAQETFERVIVVDPKDAFAHCTLGIVYYSQGRYDDAVNALTRALAIDPKNATAHNYLGITASQKGWIDAAEKELRTATTLDPNYADAEFNLAVVLGTKLPPDKVNARKYYDRAIKLGAERDTALEQMIGPPGANADSDDTSPPAARKEVAPAPAAPMAGEDGATKVADKQVTVPSLPPELLPLAREAKEQFERGNYLEAEKIFRKILAKQPNNLYTLSNLGVVLFRAQKFGPSEQAFKKAIAVAPEDGFSHCTLGIVYYSEGKYNDAVNELTKALAIDPANATANNYLDITPLRNQGDFLTPLEKDRLRLPNPH